MDSTDSTNDTPPGKSTDDYEAKYRMWAAGPGVCPLPQMIALPRFGSKKFSSYSEFNEWKQELLDTIAAAGGVQWTK